MNTTEEAEDLRRQLNTLRERIKGIQPSFTRWIDGSELVDMEDVRALLNGLADADANH